MSNERLLTGTQHIIHIGEEGPQTGRKDGELGNITRQNMKYEEGLKLELS